MSRNPARLPIITVQIVDHLVVRREAVGAGAQNANLETINEVARVASVLGAADLAHGVKFTIIDTRLSHIVIGVSDEETKTLVEHAIRNSYHH